MIDMRNSNIIDDIHRIHPDIKDTDGILNIDIGLFFNYSNQDIITLGLGIISNDINKDEDTEDDSRYLFTDTVLNHRYPNKGYITISQKAGRKISKTGYPVVAPIKKLNGYHMLVVIFGIQDETGTLCFPMNICLSKENPIGGLELKIHDWEKPKPVNYGIELRTHSVNDDGTERIQRYIIGKPRFELENDVMLQPVKTGRTNLIGFDPVINIIGQPKNVFYL